MSEQPLPCPFCGSAPQILDYQLSAMVHCSACGASAQWQHGRADCLPRAVIAWNRRVPAQGEGVPEPDWSQAEAIDRWLSETFDEPLRVEWYGIDSNGAERWFVDKPTLGSEEKIPSWVSDGYSYWGGMVDLPLGIDWRTTLRRRPQGQEGRGS